MFEHYSVADLFANLYKKRKANILALIALFLSLLYHLQLKQLRIKILSNDTTSYSNLYQL